MKKTFELFERFFLSKKRFPQYFEYSREQIDKMKNLFDSGLMYPLLKRDTEGCLVAFVQPRRIDLEHFTLYDQAGLTGLLGLVIMQEEETHIFGIVVIVDCKAITLKHLYSPPDVINLVNIVKTCFPVNIRNIYMINMPFLANAIFEFAISLLDDDLKKLIVLVKNYDELKKIKEMNSLLPKELGGTVSEAEMMKHFKRVWMERDEKVQRTLDNQIEWSKVNVDKVWCKANDEAVGSFRKLELD